MESSSEFLLLFKLPEQTKRRQRRQVPRSPRSPRARGPALPSPPAPSHRRNFPSAPSLRQQPPAPSPAPAPPLNFPPTEPPRKRKQFNSRRGSGGVERERTISQIIISGRCTSLFGFPDCQRGQASGDLPSDSLIRRNETGKRGT